MKVPGIRACVFDAYGTLFDVHSAVGRLRPKLGDKADAVSALWRAKQLEYTWLRTLMREYQDFWAVTGDALDYALESHRVHDAALREELMQAYLALDAFEEVPGVLEQLKRQALVCAILSNGTPKMLDRAVHGAGLDARLDHVWSVDKLGLYKPDPRTYAMATDTLGVDPAQVCFLSSNAFDVAGAATFGFKVVWINRFEQKRDRLPGEPVARIRTLDELTEMVSDGD